MAGCRSPLTATTSCDCGCASKPARARSILGDVAPTVSVNPYDGNRLLLEVTVHANDSLHTAKSSGNSATRVSPLHISTQIGSPIVRTSQFTAFGPVRGTGMHQVVVSDPTRVGL